ncbi:modulator of smoothened protein [Sphaerodactylus townsendi]|uniref:modulator of smoothened protein n=1 Tax=Sphaerodactylus townsendi TaxID=933632 RepID=UPI00202705AB|nr:modulator of smoothened protein [Sphaerodactylus townsendi]
MDKLTIISGCLFLAADIFAIASLANPDWINTGESAGNQGLLVFGGSGVVRSSLAVKGISTGTKPVGVGSSSLLFICRGCGLRDMKRKMLILFCMAALIFPIGFYINEVGGQPYKLPNNTVVGSSYVLFVLSIFFTIVGLLFAGKVCLPG